MELIKQLNEELKTSMDPDTFNRLVQVADDNIDDHEDDVQMIDTILGIVEDVAGFEDPDDAFKLAHEVLDAVKGKRGL